MTLQHLLDALKVALPTGLALFNWMKSAKKTDLDSLRKRVSILERAFNDLFDMVVQFLDEQDNLVDGLPHGLRSPFRSQISTFRTTLIRQRDRLHDKDKPDADKTDA